MVSLEWISTRHYMLALSLEMHRTTMKNSIKLRIDNATIIEFLNKMLLMVYIFLKALHETFLWECFWECSLFQLCFDAFSGFDRIWSSLVLILWRWHFLSKFLLFLNAWLHLIVVHMRMNGQQELLLDIKVIW